MKEKLDSATEQRFLIALDFAHELQCDATVLISSVEAGILGGLGLPAYYPYSVSGYDEIRDCALQTILRQVVGRGEITGSLQA